MYKENIFDNVKAYLAIPKDDPSFDGDIIPLIELALSTLNQVGVGVYISFDKNNSTWSDFIPDIESDKTKVMKKEAFGNVKGYVCLSVRMMFDPPTAATLGVFEKNVSQALWRCNLAFDNDTALEGIYDG